MNRRLWIRALCLLLPCAMLMAGCGKKEEKDKKDKKEEKEVRVITNNDNKEEEKQEETPESNKKNILVALDPGHQGWDVDMSATEPNAPGSSEMKTKATTGTSGSYTNIPEFQLALDISLLVKAELENRGYDVIMTREDNETAISNAERATKANDAGANVMVRIHANGSEDPSASGALALVSSPDNAYVGSLYEDSYRLADTVLNTYCQTTGMANDGIQQNDTMTGINWSKIPVMILEMGFMSNESDDRNMADDAYRQKMVQGIVDGIDSYFGQADANADDSRGEPLEDLNSQITALVQSGMDQGEKWSVYAENLTDGGYASVGNEQLQSASVIKLFTAATVYEHMDAVTALESSPGETAGLLKAMITVSDNDAANTLVKRLGNNDAAAGMALVNEFCQNHGYASTHMGRLMLESNEQDDNYTSVEDCGKLLKSFWNKELTGSQEILDLMGQQERRTKIPAGVPEGTVTANKTGELSDVENDVAVITAGEKSYILCVMSNQDKEPGTAQQKITEISAAVYAYMTK